MASSSYIPANVSTLDHTRKDPPPTPMASGFGLGLRRKGEGGGSGKRASGRF